MSAWVFARTIVNTNSRGNSIFNKGDQQYCLQIYGSAGAGTTNKKFESAVYTSTWRQIPSGQFAAVGSWYHVTGTWSGGASGNGTGQIYVNGVLDSSAATLAIGTTAAVRTYNLFIGANPNSNSSTTAPGTSSSVNTGTSANPRFWDGHIDEVSFSRTVRGADWIKLAYETQKPGATAMTIGNTTTSIAGARDRRASVDGFSIRSSGASFVIRLPEAEGLRVSVTDLQGREVWGLSTAGRTELIWNGRGANGELLPAGAYVARLAVREKGVYATIARQSFSMMH
jgi:hypothetical protein